jgi:phosphopantetheine adenylyltransferase
MNELDYYDALLRRLYKQDLEQIVMSYEKYRIALNIEMDRRKAEQQQVSVSMCACVYVTWHVCMSHGMCVWVYV